MNKKWNVGAIIWFVFYILCQWLMCIEYATKPATAYTPAYQQAALAYGIDALIISALILWMAIGHKRRALHILLGLAIVNTIIQLFTAGVSSAIFSFILPGINWLIARNHVE